MDEDWAREAYRDDVGDEVDEYTSKELADVFRTYADLYPLVVNVVDQPFIGADEFGVSEGVREGNIVYVYKKAYLEEIDEEWTEHFLANVVLEIDKETEDLIVNVGHWQYGNYPEESKWVTTGQGTIPLAYKTTVPSDVAPAPAPSGSGASSSDGGATIMIAAAAGAAAATAGIYLYTHPEVIQDVKDFFTGLASDVQAKVQDFTGGVRAAVGLADETAAQPAAKTPAA